MKECLAQYQSLRSAATPARYLHLSCLNEHFIYSKYFYIREKAKSYQEILKGTSLRSQRTLTLLMKLAILLKIKSGSAYHRQTYPWLICNPFCKWRILPIKKYTHIKSQSFFTKKNTVCFSSDQKSDYFS